MIWTILPGTQAIIGGEDKEWNRFGFLVKIFSREKLSNIVTSCTGTIISPRLVLTSSQCILNTTTGKRLSEFVINAPFMKGSRILGAEVVKIGETWAIMEIPELKLSMLCPPAPAPRGVAQLNVRPTLLQSSIVSIDPLKLKRKKCWVVGFATTDNATEFVDQNNIRLIALKSLDAVKNKPNFLWSPIVANDTACWDDVGAALFCSTRAWGHMLVGIFQHLIAPSQLQKTTNGGEEINITSSCNGAVEMRFSKIADQFKLFEAIQNFDITSFVSVYQHCFRDVPYSLTPGM
ncbi:unnamed protein product [Thelazia callipaeda]|uniref:Peptidase S1 domain-containing protein n=1 Tax=Thelazia callipaeda TaxID=103827 RepID=A0A0N5CKR2_THECL|nr:unnamed protein product [Thelazia callipaeda]